MPIKVTANGQLKEVIIENTSLRSEAIHEIISKKPGFITRFALLFFTSLLIMLFIASWIIHYPDVIITKAELIGINVPKEIIALQDGKLIKVVYNKNDSVKEGQAIAWIENNASHSEVLNLSAKVDSAILYSKLNQIEKITFLFTEKYNQLGELQTSYQQLISAYHQLDNYLYLLTNDTKQEGKSNSIEQPITEKKIAFTQTLQAFKKDIDDWKQKYLLTAPISGRLDLVLPLHENQFVQTGQVLGYISSGKSKYYLETYIPQNNFSKASIGQSVQIRFYAYPYNEFGYVNGKIDYISSIATDSGFIANISLSKEPITSHQKTIRYISGLKADALILTKDVRLLERFFYQTKGILSR
jgi:multidrug resistance efflux pump